MTPSAAAASADIPGLTQATTARGSRRRLGAVLAELGYLTSEEVEEAVARSRSIGRLLGQLLVEEGRIDSNQLARALAERNGLPHVDLSVFEFDRRAASLIDLGMARRYETLPIAFTPDRALLVATADPAKVLAFDDITMATGYEIRTALASPEDIHGLIAQLSSLDATVRDVEHEEAAAEVIELRDLSDNGPVVKAVNSIIADAVERGASDVHFEPRASDMRVRFRVDGVVKDATFVPRRLVAGVLSRIKIMAELDIAQRQAPQDGRIGLTVDGRYVDLRVAILPVVHGESIVMRILDVGSVAMELSQLGMPEGVRRRLESALNAASGAVLVTGPTGSGKTTTLYAGLRMLDTPEKALITLEDPVEYELEGVKQVQVNPRTGLTFADGLRSIVRSDPDVIMVGEVRDRETAKIAVESALTGHLVLSTLHSNSAPMVAARLIEMGVEPFLVASGIECVVAQRLVRRLCDCKRRASLSKEMLTQNGFDAEGGIEAWEAVGCVRCSGSGYRGRVGLYEAMGMSDTIRELIRERASGHRIQAAAQADGMTTLREDGLDKVRAGITSAPEVLRVLGTDRS